MTIPTSPDILARKPVLRVIGLMSGTSADGIDAALVDVHAHRVEVLALASRPYPPTVRSAVLQLATAETLRLDDLCRWNVALGERFAAAALAAIATAGVPHDSVDLIGSHGQTVRHLPRPHRTGGYAVRATLQIAAPAVIAERTRLPVVADFRPRDQAAEGEGAPLVPFADHWLYAHGTRTRAVLNIGGIANVTFLPAGGGLASVLAFDTGPGNMVLDRLMHVLSNGRQRYDRNGALAARGTVCEPLLRELLRHPFLRRRPPKSTGREDFGTACTDALLARGGALGLSDADVMATAAGWTAGSVAEAFRRFAPAPVDEVILCGGGARNATLTGMLAERLAPARLTTTEEYGLAIEAKEAVSFAILAAATVRGVPNNVPTATGAKRSVILGSLTPA